jgi:hypothetical protein
VGFLPNADPSATADGTDLDTRPAFCAKPYECLLGKELI